jgi:hypothetical protein
MAHAATRNGVSQHTSGGKPSTSNHLATLHGVVSIFLAEGVLLPWCNNEGTPSA